jgi:predicted metal-dependent hydrolase
MIAHDQHLQYDLVRSRRTTTDIVVERDGRVVVRAPQHLSDKRIARMVDSRRLWIYKTLAEWRDANATRIIREYRNGEGFLYLGRSYRLLLVSDQDEPVILKNGRFCLRRDLVEGADTTTAKAAFRDFYITRGRERLRQRVEYFEPKVGVSVRGLTVRDLGNRWGACSPKGNLSFHWKCLMAPATVIDYIVVHELCHLHHLDHTELFWNEVDKILPTYSTQKDWLRKHGAAMNV